MSTALELESITDQHAFNIERWREICADSELAAYPGRVESNRYGHVQLMPPRGFTHSRRQGRIVSNLTQLLPSGEALPECPISTREGVRGADAVWISGARLTEACREEVLVIAPEICVEVLSPSNSRDEVEEKRDLYFEAGAEEVWICDLVGRMHFFLKAEPTIEASQSARCPDFPPAV